MSQTPGFNWNPSISVWKIGIFCIALTSSLLITCPCVNTSLLDGFSSGKHITNCFNSGVYVLFIFSSVSSYIVVLILFAPLSMNMCSRAKLGKPLPIHLDTGLIKVPVRENEISSDKMNMSVLDEGTTSLLYAGSESDGLHISGSPRVKFRTGLRAIISLLHLKCTEACLCEKKKKKKKTGLWKDKNWHNVNKK